MIIGGWAHRLYRLHSYAKQLDYSPLTTLDTDIALPPQLPPGEHDIRARLLEHGFTEEFCGDDHPPATHYELGGHASGFYAEFLTPLIGSELNRGQERIATAQTGGIISQRLRYIEVRRRGHQDRAKDILYIHDTLEVFGARLPELAELWRVSIASHLPARASRRIVTASAWLFAETSDDLRRAAAMSSERGLRADQIREACAYGLLHIFAPKAPRPLAGKPRYGKRRSLY